MVKNIFRLYQINTDVREIYKPFVPCSSFFIASMCCVFDVLAVSATKRKMLGCVNEVGRLEKILPSVSRMDTVDLWKNEFKFAICLIDMIAFEHK